MSSPVTNERKSLLPLRLRSTTFIGSSNRSIEPQPTTAATKTMPTTVEKELTSPFQIGSRVLVNGIKKGTIRYAGTVKFTQGLFFGIELDDAEGKHDGQVNDFRYFQCKMNHGIFVPQNKVILAPSEPRFSPISSINKSKLLTVTRSMTFSYQKKNYIEQTSIPHPSTCIQLPDIIPSPNSTESSIELNVQHDTMDSKEDIKGLNESIVQSQTLPADEPLQQEFLESVSSILNQLQQEQNRLSMQTLNSMTISEEGTIDDDDDDDDLDSESINESVTDENHQMLSRLSSTNGSVTSLNIKKPSITSSLIHSQSLSNSTKSLANKSLSSNKSIKIDSIENKNIPNQKKLNIPKNVPSVKKDPLKKPMVRDSSFISSKNESSANIKSNSKSNRSLIPSKSSSSINQTKLTKIPSKTIVPNTQPILRSNSNKDDQNSVIQSIKLSNEHLRKENEKFLKLSNVMTIVNQYHMTENERIKEVQSLTLSKVQTENNRLKNSIEELELFHENQMKMLRQQYEQQIVDIKENHQKLIIEHKQKYEQLLNEKEQCESRCKLLETQVNRFMYEMENSEFADPLLRRVDILEKDNASLQTVVEMRNQELTQLRTKLNEQTFQREDQLILQKRIDMVENRNQDLVCLIRNWQLQEKTVAVQRDQLKEHIGQLERDNRQLKFENETLLYCIRQRSSTISMTPTTKSYLVSNESEQIPQRARSFSLINEGLNMKKCPTHFSSLNSLLDR